MPHVNTDNLNIPEVSKHSSASLVEEDDSDGLRFDFAYYTDAIISFTKKVHKPDEPMNHYHNQTVSGYDVVVSKL